MTISTLQVFQEEVPRAKARQQLREAQNNDASRGLGGVKIQGPPNPLIQVLYFIRGEMQFIIQLEPPKKASNNWGFRRIAPLEMSKSSHLTSNLKKKVLTSQGFWSLGTSQQSGALRDAIAAAKNCQLPEEEMQPFEDSHGGFLPQAA